MFPPRNALHYPMAFRWQLAGAESYVSDLCHTEYLSFFILFFPAGVGGRLMPILASFPLLEGKPETLEEKPLPGKQLV